MKYYHLYEVVTKDNVYFGMKVIRKRDNQVYNIIHGGASDGSTQVIVDECGYEREICTGFEDRYGLYVALEKKDL